MSNDPLQFTDPENRPTRADAVRNRALLLDTAQDLFASCGVESVSMSAIAEAAGVGKGTLYRHFANKSELCQALLDHDMQKLQTQTLEHLRSADDPLDKLRWFIDRVARFALRNNDLLSVEARESDGGLLQHPAHAWMRRTLRGLLAQLGLPGDVDYLADVLYVMLDARTLRYQRAGLGYDDARILDGVQTLALKIINP